MFEDKMKTFFYAVEIVLLAFLTALWAQELVTTKGVDSVASFTFENEAFRQLCLPDDFLLAVGQMEENTGIETNELITTAMFCCSFKEPVLSFDKGAFFEKRNAFVRQDAPRYMRFKALYAALLDEMIFFPVPVSTKETGWVSYENSWGYERTYGGERKHEGTDIFATENVRGLYPVVAVADGVVEQKGWLEKGGYRVGIRSSSGIYYYYAHLASYTEFNMGDKIKAGQLLGYMGDTGYSKVEGTTGKFPVHLHFGIYIDEEGEEIALNPYWLLKRLEKKVLYYPY